MSHKIKKAWTSDSYYVVETDDSGVERRSTLFGSLAKAKKRALERKDIMGDKRTVTIEKILFYAG